MEHGYVVEAPGFPTQQESHYLVILGKSLLLARLFSDFLNDLVLYI